MKPRRVLLVVSAMLVSFLAYGSLMPVPREAEVNVNYPGSDLRNIASAHPIACKESCLRDVRCLSWTWVRPVAEGQLGRCWLKSTSPNPVADRCCISGVRPITGRMEMGVDRPGSDYKRFVPADARACENACYADRVCKAWTFVKPNTIQGPNAQCYLKNRVPRPLANTACISGGKPVE